MGRGSSKPAEKREAPKEKADRRLTIHHQFGVLLENILFQSCQFYLLSK